MFRIDAHSVYVTGDADQDVLSEVNNFLHKIKASDSRSSSAERYVQLVKSEDNVKVGLRITTDEKTSQVLVKTINADGLAAESGKFIVGALLFEASVCLLS